jgi:glutaredoxin
VAHDLERRQEMIQKSGQMGVPVISIGDDIIVGFDRDRLVSTLSLAV